MEGNVAYLNDSIVGSIYPDMEGFGSVAPEIPHSLARDHRDGDEMEWGRYMTVPRPM